MADTNLIAGLRRWIQTDDDRRERERELPRALCRVCGGWAKAGEGTRDAEPVRGVVSDPMRDGVMIVTPESAPRDADDWRRECDACATGRLSDLVTAVTGREVTDHEASTVVAAMKSFDDRTASMRVTFPTAQASGTATGKPWGHVTADDRERVRQVLREARAAHLPKPCTWGACGMCGVRTSVSWFDGPDFLRWPDGSPAPCCATCHAVLDRRREPYDMAGLRTLAVEAATGHAQMFYRAPEQFRMYSETRGCDGNGYPDAWDYGDGIRQFREDVWTSSPSLAPEDRRAEYQAKADARAAERRAEEQRQREADAASAW